MLAFTFEPVLTTTGKRAYYVVVGGARPAHGPYRVNTLTNALEAALREARSLPDSDEPEQLVVPAMRYRLGGNLWTVTGWFHFLVTWSRLPWALRWAYMRHDTRCGTGWLVRLDFRGPTDIRCRICGERDPSPITAAPAA